MINKIIDGISTKLDQVFGEDYTIYSEKVNQGLVEPCFFITFLNAEQTKRLGHRYFRRHFFNIHYMPSGPDKNLEMNTVSEILLEELEFIDVDGDLVQGTNINFEPVNGSLHFFVSYNVHALKVTDNFDQMEDVSIKTGLKEG